MAKPRGSRTWTIPNQLGSATAAACEALEWIDDFPVADQSKYSIRLVLEEMLSNTIKYGYPDNREHPITIRIDVADDLIHVELVDDANPFDPTSRDPADIPGNIESGVDGGFGIELVRRLCRHMAYRRRNKRNFLTLHVATLDPDDDPAQSTEPAT